MTTSLLLEAPGRFRIVTTDDIPEPGADEVRVRVHAAGVCGSDRELFDGGRPEAFRRYPIVPGHEWSGVVEAIGPGGQPDLIGKPVVGEGFHNCQRCVRCRTGDTNLCLAGYDETGFTRPGAFSTYVMVPVRLLHILDEQADLTAAALLEPAAVAAATVLRAAPQPGERVAVVGAGTLGMLAIQMLASLSPARLVAVDPRESREDVAKDGGATELLTPERAKALHGELDVVIETAGARDTAMASLRLPRRGGRVVLSGIPAGEPVGISPGLIVEQQLSIASVFGASSAEWEYAVRAFNAGLFRLSSLITHELPLTEYARALDLLGEPGTGKILMFP